MIRIAIFVLVSFILDGIQAQQKKALVVAIGNYPESSGFRNINSINDLPLIQNALFKLGFKETDILILKDEQATKKQIVESLGKNLLNSLKPGDIAYFHFSGHGQQVLDKNADELDGLDESLVPYDASVEFKPGIYEGENHITDDDLQQLFSNIRTQLGPKGHLLTTIDACHSGTITRHIGIARGTDIIMAPPNSISKLDKNKNDINQSEFKNEDETKMASMVAFFGSMANQLNYEILGEDGKEYGALSYAFSKAFNAIPSESSYQQLFDRIRLIIQTHVNNQIPEASGILSQSVLGGKYLGTPNYYLVKEWVDSTHVSIEAGFLNGINKGTVVGFYPAESRNLSNATPFAIGTIEKTGSNSSIVLIPEGISSDKIEHAWVIVKEENFGDLMINLQLRGSFKTLDRGIFTDLFALPYINKVDSNADLVLLEDSKNISLISRNDIEIAAISKTSSWNDLFYNLKSAITEFGQSQFLRKLTQENKQIAIEFQLILVRRNGNNIDESSQKDSIQSLDGKIIFKKADVVKVKVTNKGNKPAYYTLLDIQPNNKTNVLLPQANESPSDYFLNPGQSYVVQKEFRLDPPLGQELFKIIATKNPINLRPLDQRRSIADDYDKDPFAKLIQYSYYKDEKIMHRGITSNVPPGQVNIYAVPFVIE